MTKKINNFEINYNEKDFKISLNEINRAFDALEICQELNWLAEADSVDVWMLGLGEFTVSFLWRGEEYEECAPTWYNVKIIVRKDYYKIEKMGGTCYPTPVDKEYEHFWIINKEGKLLKESTSK